MGQGLEVTSVRLLLIEDDRLKAYASVLFNESLIVQDIKVVTDDKGQLFVVMPNRPMPIGPHKDICYGINIATRDMIRMAVLDAYKENQYELGCSHNL